MFLRVSESVPRAGRTPVLFWQVRAYDSNGVMLTCRLYGSLTRAYRERDAVLRAGAAVVVVEVA